MPDIADRRQREKALADRLDNLFKLASDAGDQLQWSRFRQEVENALNDELAALFLVVFYLLLSDDLSGSLSDAQAFSLFGNPTRGATIAGELADSAKAALIKGRPPEEVFTRSRAESIAATEITRTVTQAEAAARKANAAAEARKADSSRPANSPVGGDDLQKYAPPITPDLPLRTTPSLLIYWITEADGRVCALCGPLHNREYETWAATFPEGPPAHPNCRCYLSYSDLAKSST